MSSNSQGRADSERSKASELAAGVSSNVPIPRKGSGVSRSHPMTGDQRETRAESRTVHKNRLSEQRLGEQSMLKDVEVPWGSKREPVIVRGSDGSQQEVPVGDKKAQIRSRLKQLASSQSTGVSLHQMGSSVNPREVPTEPSPSSTVGSTESRRAKIPEATTDGPVSNKRVTKTIDDSEDVSSQSEIFISHRWESKPKPGVEESDKQKRTKRDITNVTSMGNVYSLTQADDEDHEVAPDTYEEAVKNGGNL